jgi:hypothetical protein
VHEWTISYWKRNGAAFGNMMFPQNTNNVWLQTNVSTFRLVHSVSFTTDLKDLHKPGQSTSSLPQAWRQATVYH